jgi:hypothetical protein
MSAPPSEAGTVHETVDWLPSKDVAVTRVGAAGTVEGTAAADAVDATELPDAFVAVTLNV